MKRDQPGKNRRRDDDPNIKFEGKIDDEEKSAHGRLSREMMRNLAIHGGANKPTQTAIPRPKSRRRGLLDTIGAQP
jgi:hypothetical protein